MRRGEVWWASLRKPRGSEPGFRRPIVIVQSDAFNASRIDTVVAVILTSNLSLAAAPGNTVVGKRHSGLPRDSVANVSQVVTINKTFLTERAGIVPSSLMSVVDEGLRLILSL